MTLFICRLHQKSIINIITPQNVVNFNIVGYNINAGGDGFEFVSRDNTGGSTEEFINAKTI